MVSMRYMFEEACSKKLTLHLASLCAQLEEVEEEKVEPPSEPMVVEEAKL